MITCLLFNSWISICGVLFLFEFCHSHDPHLNFLRTEHIHMHDCSNSFGLIVVLKASHEAGLLIKDDDTGVLRDCLNRACVYIGPDAACSRNWGTWSELWTFGALRVRGDFYMEACIKLFIILDLEKKRLICQHTVLFVATVTDMNTQRLNSEIAAFVRTCACIASDLSDLLVTMPPSPVCALHIHTFENGDFQSSQFIHHTIPPRSCHPAYLSWYD